MADNADDGEDGNDGAAVPSPQSSLSVRRVCWIGPKGRMLGKVVFAIAAAGNALVFPFHLAFLGAPCFSDDVISSVIYLVLDVPLWASALRSVGRSLERQWRCKGALCTEGSWWWRSSKFGWRRLLDVVALMCCIPWDWLFGSGLCYSYGHISRCYFVGGLATIIGSIIDTIFPALGAKRASAMLIGLVLTSVIVLHWYACFLYVVPYAFDGNQSWIVVSALDERPLWARYIRCFDRGLLIMLGEGEHGETDVEVRARAPGGRVPPAHPHAASSCLRAVPLAPGPCWLAPGPCCLCALPCWLNPGPCWLAADPARAATWMCRQMLASLMGALLSPRIYTHIRTLTLHGGRFWSPSGDCFWARVWWRSSRPR